MSEEEEANEIIRRLATPPPKYNQDDLTIEMWIYPKPIRKNGWVIIETKTLKLTKSLGD